MHDRARFFLFMNVGFVAGVGVGSLWTVSVSIAGAAFAVGVAAMVSLRGRRAVLVGFLLLGAGLGFIRTSISTSWPPHTLEGSIRAEGAIVDEPHVDRQQTFVVGLDDGKRVRVTVPRLPAFHAGDRIRLACDRPTSIGGKRSDGLIAACRFPAIVLLSRDHPSLLSSLGRLRTSLERRVSRTLPEPSAAFLNGLLFGSKSELPPAVLDAFNRTGTTHIVALSGYNVTILAVLIAAVFSIFPLPRRVIFLLTLATIAGFILMTGASPSVVRAGLMGGLVLLSRQVGRVNNPTYLLAFAAAGMLAVNPDLLVFDRSFELSFAATAGLLFFAPWLTERLRFVPTWLALRETTAVTLAATVATFPIILLSFGRISLVGLAANLLILPAIPFAMGFGFLTLLASFLPSSLIALPAGAAWLVLTYVLSVVQFLSGLPFAAVTV